MENSRYTAQSAGADLRLRLHQGYSQVLVGQCGRYMASDTRSLKDGSGSPFGTKGDEPRRGILPICSRLWGGK